MPLSTCIDRLAVTETPAWPGMRVQLRLLFVCTFAVVYSVLSEPVALTASPLPQPQQLEAQPRPAGSYLGIKLSEIDAERARILGFHENRGVEVRGVEEGSPADHAGIEPGDILLSFNAQSISSAQQIIRLVQQTSAGRKVKVQLWRNGKSRSAFITTVSPPAIVDDVGPFPFPYPRAILVWRNMRAGIEFEGLDSQLAEYFGVPGGVLIRWVEKDSPAKKAGLRAGDVIVSVSHRTVLTAHELTSCLRQPSAVEFVTVMRDRKKLDLKLTMAGQ